MLFVFFFKQKTAYEMRISDWSSDVCSSDLLLKQNDRRWTDCPLASYRKKTGDDISQDAFEARILSDDEFAKIWGDFGPVYGKQWRRWVDADGNEHDQIATLVDTLKNNPASRRMLFHAWNVGDLDQMALPPCHMVYQCHVTSQEIGRAHV